MDSMTTIAGALTRDPELRYTTGGRAVASFGVAVNRRYQVNGEWQESVSFINCVAWGDLGEHLAQCTTKGNRLIVTGRLEQRSYDDKDGNKRSVVELVATDVGPSLKWATADVHRIVREDAARTPVEVPA
jgi:single-strand DNA-binding protein